jgi:MerR family transcriptional regulator, thiopeptide resistance regulator
MNKVIDIKDVVRRTGLSSRALRFYEAKGLIAPLRTGSGRRIYNSADLERLHRITILKAAGLSLAQMRRLFDGKTFDLSGLLNAQLEMMDAQAVQIDTARSVIRHALSRIDQGEPVDAETFCSLIESGDKMMNQEPEEWKKVTERYFTPEEKAHWTDKMKDAPNDWAHDAQLAKWRDLGTRIKSAMPMDPVSAAALSFAIEWKVLLQPFIQAASPEMISGMAHFYARMDEWEGEVDVGFDKASFDFICQAAKAHGISMVE